MSLDSSTPQRPPPLSGNTKKNTQSNVTSCATGHLTLLRHYKAVSRRLVRVLLSFPTKRNRRLLSSSAGFTAPMSPNRTALKVSRVSSIWCSFGRSCFLESMHDHSLALFNFAMPRRIPYGSWTFKPSINADPYDFRPRVYRGSPFLLQKHSARRAHQYLRRQHSSLLSPTRAG